MGAKYDFMLIRVLDKKRDFLIFFFSILRNQKIMSRISVIQCLPQLQAEKKVVENSVFRGHISCFDMINVNITLRIREPGKGDKKMRLKVVGKEQS